MTAFKQKTYNLLLIVIISLGLPGTIKAQNNTNSPYTRFGYGQLEDQGFSRNLSMGGLSYGLRSNSNINPANPASYCVVDSTSFLFEMGISALISNFKSGDAARTTFNGNLDYLAMQFPITNWMGMSLGILPYSVVGYNYSFSDSINMPTTGEDSYAKYTQIFNGTGGISQVYLGMSFDIGHHFSIGANGYFLFGNIDHSRYLNFSTGEYSTSQLSNLHVRSFNARFGAQYHETIGDKHSFVIGAVYEFKSKLTGTLDLTTTGADTTTVNSGELFQLPNVYGGGFTYTYDNRLTVGADVTFMEYANAKFYGVTDSLNNRLKICLGGEYIHNARSNRYVDRMLWRLGANYSNSYIKVGNSNAKDFSLTCGVGFPLRTTKTMLNVNFEYGNVGSHAYSQLKENYFKIGFNLALNEYWFVKQKIK